MTKFEYRNGELHAEDVPLSRIAEAVGTPVYVYSETALTDAYRLFADALARAGLDSRVCYAMKANSNLAVVRALAACGAGADVVSGGELARALAAGMDPAEIVFSGVGKTADEMEQAIAFQIGQFNVESVPELEQLSRVAAAAAATVHVAIRVNPDVDADTHHKISTGRHHDKFGIDIGCARDVYARAAELPSIVADAVAVHIGSQLTDLSPFRAAFARVAALVAELRGDGHTIAKLDLGGGLGIDYGHHIPPNPHDYAAIVAETVGDLGCTLMFEPGRYVAGPAGVLLTEIVYIKETETRSFAIVDAAMNDLVRPAMYEAHHEIMSVRAPSVEDTRRDYDIVGPVCETGDTFATQRALPALAAGELVVVRDAGAYGAVMASGYNSRPLIAEVLVRGDSFSVVRARQDIAAMLAQESLADWQT